MKTIPHTLRPYTAALLLITCCIFLLTSCEKDPYRHGEPDLPPITMEGKNTLGFLLNGKVWVPFVENPSLFSQKLEINMDGRSFRLSANLKHNNTKNSALLIYLYILDDVYKYQIPDPPSSGIVYIDQNFKGLGCNEFKCKPEDTEININHFDKERRIISGTFFFKNAANKCGDTIQITDGRFDVKY